MIEQRLALRASLGQGFKLPYEGIAPKLIWTGLPAQLSTVVTVVLALVMAACGAATILMYIDDALQIAVEAASVTGFVPPQFAAYITAGLGCVDFAATEVQSGDTPADQYNKVFTQCGALVKVDLPGLPPNLVDFATRLAVRISQILTSLLPKPVPAGKLAAAKPMKFTPAQLAHLKDVSAKAKAAQALLASHVASQSGKK